MAVDKKKLQAVMAEADAKYGKWAWQYMVDMYNKWASLDQVKNAMKNFNSKNKVTTSNNTNYTPYTKLTWDTPAGPSTKGTASDLSYMKPTNYYSSWNKWDKTIDISKDANRAKEMAYNIRQDMITNPKLFTNRDDFNKYYNYEWSSASQKKLLDEFFANANKYGLWATDNFYADMASQASTDKNMKKYAKDADTYNKMLPYLDDIRNKLNDRLSPLFDRLMENQTKYLQDMAELRKLQRQYNKGMVEEANSRAAGQSASLWTMMSWQGLSQSSIASSMFWAEEEWVKELNRIQEQHINTMKGLADAEADFTNNWAGIVSNLTQVEQWALKDWYNSFKGLQDWLDNSYKTMIDEQYSPYEVLTQAKVSGWAETLQSTGKSDIKQSEYQTWDTQKRARILYNNLSSIFWQSPDTLAKLSTYINSAAAQYNDFQTALTSILEKAWAKPQTIKSVLDKLTEDEWTESETEWQDEESETDFNNISYTSLDKYKK